MSNITHLVFTQDTKTLQKYAAAVSKSLYIYSCGCTAYDFLYKNKNNLLAQDLICKFGAQLNVNQLSCVITDNTYSICTVHGAATEK